MLPIGAALLLLATAADLILRPAGGRARSGLGRSYDLSGRGRRLEARLAEAAVGLRPSEWRLAQLCVLPPLFFLATLIGLGPPGAALLPLTAVRLGGAALLRARRGRLAHRRQVAAPMLARALAAELGAGASGARAIEAAAAGAAGGAAPMLSQLLSAAVAGVSVGQDGVTALESALGVRRRRDGCVRRPDALSVVAAGFAAQARLGASGAVALQRLGDALEDLQRTRTAARAATAEARLAAISVPIVSGLTGLLLLAAEPRALAAATAVPGCVALLGCGLVIAGGLSLVSLVTRA